MIKPLNQLNAFFYLAEERMLKGSDQLLYLHLFNLFNKAHWTETIRITDKELMSAMRLYDSTGKPAHVNTIRNAKSRLKLKGFIDFKSGNGITPTVYRLIQLYPPCDAPNPSPCGDPNDNPCDALGSSFYTLNKKDVKTKNENDAHTRKGNEGGTLTGGENPPGGQLNLPSKNVMEKWNECKGSRLDGSQLVYLTSLESAKGTKFVLKAIEEASMRNNYGNFANISFVFLKMKIDEMLKGSEKDDGRERDDGRGDKRKDSGMGEGTGEPRGTGDDWRAAREFDRDAFERFFNS